MANQYVDLETLKFLLYKVHGVQEVIEQEEKFAEAGVDHLVFDARLGFDRWFEQIELLGDKVLPELRKA